MYVEDDKNILIIDYYSTYNWYDEQSKLSVVKQCVNVIKPLKNINISDVIIKHEKGDIQALGGICLECCVNVEVTNCKVYNGYLPAYWISFCNNVVEDKCNSYNPQYTEAGRGYSIQCLGSQDVIVENCIGKDCRHLIDFSGGAYLTAKNMRHINNLINQNLSEATNNFDYHGMGEHTILFDNCNGGYTFGNGLDKFPELVDNIRIVNSDVKRFIGCGTRHITIENCNIMFDCENAILVSELFINNSNIFLNT